MKTKSIFCGALVVMLLLAGCKETKEEQEPTTTAEIDTEAMYEAIFFDINDTIFDPTPDSKVPNETKGLSSLTLTSDSDFWEDKKRFFMHALGVIEIPESGTYHFKLTSAGSIYFQLDNVGLIGHWETHDKSEKTGSRYVEAGNAVFDFSYFPKDYDPYVTLEWSTDGENFEPIPTDLIKNASLQRTELWTEELTDDMEAGDNVLSEAEINDGWQLLFDGETTNGWHTYGSEGSIGSKWIVEDGALTFEGFERFSYYLSGVEFQRGPATNPGGGRDIVTDDAFENFELNIDWKISQYGNSGIFYTVLEDPKYGEGWKTSPEMQVLDNHGQKDGLIRKHRAGDLYDLISCSEVRVKPYEQWNRCKIVKNNGKVEHWMNGAIVVSFDMNSEEFQTLYANSKFSNLPDFINTGPGKISLQDHGNKVWFKNIKIKPL